MVFESVIANLLNAYLGHFIDNVNASQLQLGAWKGNVELKNLAIKEDAFASLDLPFKILHGHIGKLTAIIPWSSLYSSPVKLFLSDVYVVAVPNVMEEYDEQIEAERAWQAKKKQLNLIEMTKKNLDLQSDQKRMNFNDVAKEDDGFVTKLAAQVIRNVQILVSNIHIVYEDKFTEPQNPFQVGLTLSRIVFQTVDDSKSKKQQEKYNDEQKQELVFKVTSIDYLSIYFNCEKNIRFLSELNNESDIDAQLGRKIATNQPVGTDLDYVLKPVTFKGNLVINSKPEKFDFTLPVADIDMILEEFTVNLKKSQLHAVTSFMDSLSRMKIAYAFRKFRPRVGIHTHSSEWWQFALSSILERDIKPRRENWSWKRIKKHRQKCREYKELYKEKLLCQNATEKIAIEEELEDYERELDVFNIVLCRSQAEIECQPELEKRKQEDASKGGGWFSLSSWGLGWSSSSAKAEKETEEIVSGLKKEMTQEEKEKLYSAIGYDSSSVGVLDTPQEFVGLIVNFRLDLIRCIVTGFDENFRVGEFCMRNINLALRLRQAAKAAQVSATFDSTSIWTSNEDPSLRAKSASLDSRRRALAFARSASKNTDEPKVDFGLNLESKSFNFECTYEPKPEGVSMNMNSAVEDIEMVLTNFTSYSNKLPVETKYSILSPCTIRMISQTEADKQVMHVEFSKLDVHMAPQAFKILNNVTNAFRATPEVKLAVKTKPRTQNVIPQEDIIETAVEVTEDMNAALQNAAKQFVASAPFDTSSNASREIYLDMRNINFVVEAGIVNPQPLIKFHSSIFGQLQNSDFIKLECQSLLNYYNESLSAWEPMIEPVSYDPYPSGEPVLWKFDAVINMKEVDGQSFMDIGVESQEQLDITITRTAVNVVLSLLDTLSEESENRVDTVKPAKAVRSTSTDVQTFKNLLPFCIKLSILGRGEVFELDAGEECELNGIRFGKTEMRIQILDYMGCSWLADNTISNITEDEDFDLWKFFPSAPSVTTGTKTRSLNPVTFNPGHKRSQSSDDSSLVVLLSTNKDPKGVTTSSLFSPYWLINKTGLPMSWKSSGRKSYSVVDPGNIDYPLLMSFKQSLFSKKRMQIKIGESELSDGFPVDVVGSKGSVLVKGKDGAFYTIAIHITLSRISLTKILTAHPFYLIVNKTDHDIEYSEDNLEFKRAFFKKTTPLWPHRLKDLSLCFRYPELPDISSKFVSLTITNASSLNIADKSFYVTVEVEESGVQITLEDNFDEVSPMELAQPQTSITLKSKGIGLSLVDDIAGLEIAYSRIEGIWGSIGYSTRSTQLHFKLSHMQIDNQLSDCLFSTIMSHIKPPKSVARDQKAKPFFEYSAIILSQANQQRYKYLSLLVQEFFIKIEYSLIQHLMEFSDEASTWYYRNYTQKEMIETDLDLALNSHKMLVESETTSTKILYDFIHFSPIKLTVSFSLSSTSTDDKDENATLPLGLDFIIKSAGVTLTEFQDVTFRLDCFERTMVQFTQEQLMWASIDHYKRQILKQFYAVVLGLDVIGNPVSLVMDLKQGVGDFFYEPIQGIIKGPEEAVEGLALGVASLFSNTVGGAVGALSKISGTLGEGMSSLTFDDELKKRRRQRRREEPNMAMNGIDLVEGVLGGISGIVTQPVSGAKEDGFGGFVKGVGKGLIGAVTQPATSVVDFATRTLNAVKVCVKEQKGPKRMRPPRVIVPGQPLKPYNLHEAKKQLNPKKKHDRSFS